MNKNKVKLSLIDDYIKIILIKNFLNSTFNENNTGCVALLQNTQELDSQLEKIYEALFAKLKMNDLSFDILKKELKENNSLFLKTKQNNFLNLENTLNNSNLQLNVIFNSLKSKISNLKINFPIVNN